MCVKHLYVNVNMHNNFIYVEEQKIKRISHDYDKQTKINRTSKCCDDTVIYSYGLFSELSSEDLLIAWATFDCLGSPVGIPFQKKV